MLWRLRQRSLTGSRASSSAGAGTVGVNPPEPAKVADPGIRTGVDRKASFPTKENLTLKLSADLGTVKITSLPVGSPAVVRYTAHIETDAHQPLADRLLTHYSLNAEATVSGVSITGMLPSQIAKSSAAGVQFWVTFEISVPHGYNVEVRTDAGDIETQDLGGTAILATQGGNISAGRIGTSFMRNAAPAGWWRGCKPKAGIFRCSTSAEI